MKKSYLKKNQNFIESCNDPIYALLIASFHISAAMAEGFFKGNAFNAARLALIFLKGCFKISEGLFLNWISF